VIGASPPRAKPALALTAAVIVCIATGGGGAAGAAPSVPPGCAQALALERTAASDSVTAQARYDAAVAGLAANQGCSDSQMHLVNEAYLLSMRAPAEHDLHVGNWRQDLTRANMLLQQCSNWPGLKGTKAGIDCDTQRRYNIVMEKGLDSIDHPPARATPPPPPSPAPASRPAPRR
jgi:hypothetical protein